MNIFTLFLEVIEAQSAKSFAKSVISKVLGTSNINLAKKLLNNSNKASNLFKKQTGGINVFKITKNLQKLAPKDLKDLSKEINKHQKGKAEMIFNFEGKIKLSSSFLQYGIFVPNEDKMEGKLILAMSGKEYDFGDVETSLWMTMVQAVGINGGGAGSVLWNTLWWKKRTTSKITGGVQGSLEKLIKVRKQTALKYARNQKVVNKQLYKQSFLSRMKKLKRR